ncbi:three-helix bundle dimerization domain-containing protein [Sinomonas atrocyanea]
MEPSEAQALASVRSRLAAQFPDAAEEDVDSAVAAAHSQMTGPVRDYVPMLVERLVRERLTRQLGRHALPISDGAPRPS